MTRTDLTLVQRMCKRSTSLDLTTAGESLKVLAELFVEDPAARTEFWRDYERHCAKRRQP